MENLKALAYELREDVIDIIMSGKAGHIGGDMSVMEILTELYFDQMNVGPANMDDPDRDKFVMSKGHSVEAYYAVLAKKGFFDRGDLVANFSKFGSKYIGHPNNKLPGIEMNSGSLGHGLPVCVGMALAGKMNGQDYRVYTVMGDGEVAEGSVWEGAMAASHYKLAKTIKGKPTMVIANTVKGKGSSVMENKANWHHKVPNEEELVQIRKDLKERKEALR